jgi:hypothetical protein
MTEPSSNNSAVSPPQLLLDSGIILLLLSLYVYRFCISYADPDLWGHIKVGQDFLRCGTVSLVDSYSYMSGKTPLVDHEWLIEIACALIYNKFGVSGLCLLRMMFDLSLVAGLFLVLRQVKISALHAGLLVLALAFVLRPFTGTLRPQDCTYLCFFLTLYCIKRADEGAWKWFYFLPLVFLAWGNLHGGYLAGLGVLGFWCAAKVVGERFLKSNMGATTGIKQLFIMAAVFVASLLAVLVTPYGAGGLLALLHTAMGQRPDIGEWAPLQLTETLGLFYLVILAASALAIVTSKERLSLPCVALWILIALCPLLVMRHLPLFVIASIVLNRQHIHSAWTRLFPTSASSEQIEIPITIQAIFVCMSLIVLGGSVWFSQSNFTRMPVDIELPSAATDLLSGSGVTGNLVVAPMDWGEYLIWHISPGIKVSYDGRREVAYGDHSRQLNLDFMKGIGAWDSILTSCPSDMALVSTAWPCFNLLKLKPGWQLIFQDQRSALFARDGTKQLELLQAQKIKNPGQAKASAQYFP